MNSSSIIMLVCRVVVNIKTLISHRTTGTEVTRAGSSRGYPMISIPRNKLQVQFSANLQMQVSQVKARRSPRVCHCSHINKPIEASLLRTRAGTLKESVWILMENLVPFLTSSAGERGGTQRLHQTLIQHVNLLQGHMLWCSGLCVDWGCAAVFRESSALSPFCPADISQSFYIKWIDMIICLCDPRHTVCPRFEPFSVVFLLIDL